MSDVKSIIEQLESIASEDLINIKIPSLYENRKFKSVSVKQHKDIIKTIMSGIEGSIRLGIIYNNIILNNCATPNVDFKMRDRNYILLNLRESFISDEIKLKEHTYSLSDLPVYNYTEEYTETVEYNNIIVNLTEPTISKDTLITEKCLFEFSKISSESKKVEESVGIVLTHEIIKFIKNVSINDNTIEFDSLSMQDKKSVVDKLPLKLNNKIIDHINRYKEKDASFYTFADGERVTFDASFLTGE
jgi:hypothetical protein